MPRVKTERTPAHAALDRATEALNYWIRSQPDLDFSTLQVSIPLALIGKAVERNNDLVAQECLGIKGPDFRLLLAMHRDGKKLRPTDLFRILLVSSAAMTKQIDRMEAMGLLKRLEDPNDRRGFLIQLTRRGRQLAEAGIEALTRDGRFASAVAALTKIERATLERLLHRLITSLDESLLTPNRTGPREEQTIPANGRPTLRRKATSHRS